MNKEEFIIDLFKRNIIKTGEFILKNGEKTNIQFDFSSIITYPRLMKKLAHLIYEKALQSKYQFDNLVAVPYNTVPLTSSISVLYNKPMLLKKKKNTFTDMDYITGHYQSGDRCLLIADVLTDGLKIKKTIQDLNDKNIIVENVIVAVDRRYNKDIVFDYKLDSIMTYQEIKDVLYKRGLLGDLTLLKRMDMLGSSIGMKLSKIIMEKKTNLVFSVDISNKTEFLKLVNEVGPYICILKTHIDVVNDFDSDLIKKLIKMKEHYNFLIMEDRKFSDTGDIVIKQYCDGPFHIRDWADIVTVHGVMGRATIEGLVEMMKDYHEERGILILAEAYGEHDLTDARYHRRIFEMAEEYHESVLGFMSQRRLFQDEYRFIYATPGVNIDNHQDHMLQTYRTPESIIGQDKSDLIIVGRAIYESDNVKEAAKQYKESGWKCLVHNYIE